MHCCYGEIPRRLGINIVNILFSSPNPIYESLIRIISSHFKGFSEGTVFDKHESKPEITMLQCIMVYWKGEHVNVQAKPPQHTNFTNLPFSH